MVNTLGVQHNKRLLKGFMSIPPWGFVPAVATHHPHLIIKGESAEKCYHSAKTGNPLFLSLDTPIVHKPFSPYLTEQL